MNKVEVEEISQKPSTSINQDPKLSNYAEDGVNKIILYYSDWTKLKRAVIWWLRVRRYLQIRARKALDARNQASLSKSLTLQEIEEADRAIVRHVQRDKCPSELYLLEASKDEVSPDDGRLKYPSTNMTILVINRDNSSRRN